ncbi:unnamed protein product [Symbiodinium sp. CCMP2456]|nr:unnamed protein product [Symbiodinium sp. CCMP2456]
MEAEACRWIKNCCAEVPGLLASSSFCCSAENQASSTPSRESSACSLPGSIRIPGAFCFPAVQERMDYVIAASARPSPSLYPICPASSQAQLQVSAGAQTLGNCSMASFSLNPTSFKVQYIQRQTITTHTKAAFLTALSSALALTTYIEMAVTVVVILILRQLGCVREIKKFSWGEILNEQRDPELERKEMEERMQANVMLHLESQEKSLKGQQSELLGKVYFERRPVTD